MTYQLIRLDDGAGATVGHYPDYRTALRARVDDVIDVLGTHGGWRTRAEHVIVGPGRDGAQTSHPLCTELGVDPQRPHPPTEADLDDARAWLLVAHDLPPEP